MSNVGHFAVDAERSGYNTILCPPLTMAPKAFVCIICITYCICIMYLYLYMYCVLYYLYMYYVFWCPLWRLEDLKDVRASVKGPRAETMEGDLTERMPLDMSSTKLGFKGWSELNLRVKSLHIELLYDL